MDELQVTDSIEWVITDYDLGLTFGDEYFGENELWYYTEN